MNVCVFCSSGDGLNPVYASSALETGKMLALRGDTIIHGGAVNGLMGKLTEGAFIHGGRIIGVSCPQIRASEVISHNDFEMIEMETLAQRKSKMLEISDEFIILPGGFGTLDETCEIITLKQLQLISQPISFINVNGYWDSFFAFINVAEIEKMIITKDRDTFRVYSSIKNYFDVRS